MKKLFVALSFILFTYSSLFSAQTNTTAAAQPQNKIIILPLQNKTVINPANYQFYSASLARSIKNTLSRNIPSEFSVTRPADAELIRRGYNYRVEGQYIVQGNEISIEFSVVHIERKIITVQANVEGFADNRIFDLVDKISERVAEAAAKPLPAQVTTATVININREGRITTRAESLSNVDMRNRNFSRRDLRGRNLSNSNFSGSNFERANLASANLSGANFSRANMEGANLQSANAIGANFSGTDMRGAKLRGANLRGARFNYTNLGNADISPDAPEFRDAAVTEALFDKRKIYLGVSIYMGLNFFDKSAYAINPFYSNISGKRVQVARGFALDFMYFFNESWGIKFSTGWRQLETSIDETGYDYETAPLGNVSIRMHNKASTLIFELSAIYRIKSFHIYAGFYGGALLSFSGNMYADYAVTFSSGEIYADNSFGNKMLFGLTFGGGYTLRLSRIFSLLFSLNFQLDITKWFSNTALDNFSSTQPIAFSSGSQLKNLRQTSILLRISLLWGLK